MRRRFFDLGVATAFLIWASSSTTGNAQVTFAGSQTNNQLSASVTFAVVSGTNLQVTLTDTYTGDTVDQSHVLTGVFFSGATGLTPVSASAGAGSKEWEGTTSYAVGSAPGSQPLGSEWAYASGSGAPNGAASGIVSAGFWNVVGMGNFGGGSNMLDGSDYGLLSAGYAGSDQDGLDGRIYIQDSMVFVLSGFTGSLTSITNVNFQYGTSFGGEPNVTGVLVPEPSSLMPAGMLCLIAGVILCRNSALRTRGRAS